MSGTSTLPGCPAQFGVRRRFADFQWLFDELMRSHQGYIVPPLPDSSVLNKLNKFDKTLLSYRARELQRFLRRVARHPVLRNAPHLHSFLLPDSEFEERKVRDTTTVATKAGSVFSGLFGNVKKAVQASVPALAGGPPEERDAFFKEKSSHLEQLGKGFASCGRAVSGLVEGARQWRQCIQMSQEGASIMAMAESVEEAGSEQQRQWRSASEAYRHDGEALEECWRGVQIEHEDALHDYERYVEQVQLALKHRWDRLVDVVAAERSLEAKKAATKQDMADIEQAELMVTNTTATYERVTVALKEEITRFEQTKAKELMKALQRLGQLQVAYHLKAADAYKTLFMN